MELKKFVDFAYSMTKMEEVVKGEFLLPKELIFELEENEHIKIHKRIKEEKNDYDYSNIKQEFDVTIFDINFRFKPKN